MCGVVGFLSAAIFLFFFSCGESFKVSWLHRYKYAKNKMYRCARSQGHRHAGTVNRPGSCPVLSGSQHTGMFIKKALYCSDTKIYLFSPLHH